MEKRILKIMMNKAGGTAGKNSYNCRVSLPNSWINEMGITKEDREVNVTFENGKIIIEKLK